MNPETTMQIVGRVESLWRYPVKSMRGEPLTEAFAGFSGIYGDRVYAIKSTGAAAGFPYLTSREQEIMLLYQPAFKHPDRMLRPPNLDEAEALGPGVTPVYAAASDTALEVKTPDGDKLSIDDPRLIERLARGLGERHELSILRSDRSMTDCRPMSVFNVWTARKLSDEVGVPLDQRRFRANIYADLSSREGFAENALVGHTLRIGSKATVAILERDPRCKMITLDPDTAQQNPEVMRCLARRHEGQAGLYGAVLVEGTIRCGDEIALLN
jgi:uncharacterized protein YcbX